MIHKLFDTDIEIKIHPEFPNDKVIITNRFGVPLKVIDMTDYRKKFFHLLNLGSVSE